MRQINMITLAKHEKEHVRQAAEEDKMELKNCYDCQEKPCSYMVWDGDINHKEKEKDLEKSLDI